MSMARSAPIQTDSFSGATRNTCYRRKRIFRLLDIVTQKIGQGFSLPSVHTQAEAAGLLYGLQL